MGVPYPTLTPEMMCRFAISQKLDFDPGTRYAYSQSGYLILARIVEKITGTKYEDAVRDKILAPAGVTTLKLGRSLLSQREPDEVKYYNYPGATQTTTAVVPNAPLPAERQYANYWVEQAEAYGGWLGNAVDLMKYINALEGRRGPSILNAASLAAIVVRPSITPTGEYVGLTWRIDAVPGGAHWWHSGGAVGSRNLLARRQNNRDWVVLMNSRPLDEDTILTEIFNAFAKAEMQVTSWPASDLFADFGGPVLSASAQSLTFNALLGATAAAAAQTLQLTASPSAVNFTVAAPGVSWPTVDRLSGMTPAALNIGVNPAGLQMGPNQTVLRITAPQASNGSLSIPVTLNVTATPGFTAIRNGASLQAAAAAAPGSRVVVEAADWGSDATVKVSGIDAQVVAATPTRIDFVIPPDVPLGDAVISVTTASGNLLQDRLPIAAVSPGMFSASGDGAGAALANAINADGTALPAYDCGSGTCVTVPLDLGPDSTTVAVQFAVTGVRSQTDPGAYAVTVGDQMADVTAIDVSAAVPGVDLVTVNLPRSLAGLGDLDVIVTVGGRTSNAVRITIL